MSAKSVLSAIGHFVAKIFSPGAIQLEASIAELALPQFTQLIQLTAGAIINVENASIVAGVQTGTGTQKLQIVISTIEKQYVDFCTLNNIPVIPANMKAFVDAMVAAMNSFPAPVTAGATK